MTRLDIERVLCQLGGGHISWFETIGSTMEEAARLAAQGAPSGAVVVAEEQTAGLGRHGHSWHSEPGLGLYFSILLRLDLPSDSLPVLNLALGLAVQEGIAAAAGLRPDLRWPNDVMLDDRKTAGILVHLSGPACIAGIGINVNHAAFPPEIAAEATSLRIASGRPHSREDLLVSILPAIHRWCAVLAGQGRAAIIREFTRRSTYAQNKRVRVHQPGGIVQGLTAGLNPSGFLIVRQDDGVESLILAGGVRPL
jgi:BirA family transcriptional regulator, biotin operon repressor / biotin---[acetyl-CoA-carboxylase] ligase